MQSKNQVVILGIKNGTGLLESNRSTDRVRPPFYFAVAARISFILYFFQSQNGVDLVEVTIFYKSVYKSEKTSGQTAQPIKIKTVALFYLIMAV